MALNDTKIQRLQGKECSYQLADGGGLYLEVQPTGKKVWRMRRTNTEPRNIRRVLDKDVLPAIGEEPVAGVTIPDILAITDAVKARGADQMALQARNVIKRLLAYAIARGKTRFNPAAAIEARFIAIARSRDVALNRQEIGRLLRGIYQSSIRRQYKLALHLLVLCMVRIGELIGARWDEIDLEEAGWLIPAERMKKDKPHLVPLSSQAVAMFEELKGLAGNSSWVLPSRNTLKEPVAHSTLNQAIRSLDLGVRGVYNKAEYLAQRREMLQWWADLWTRRSRRGGRS